MALPQHTQPDPYTERSPDSSDLRDIVRVIRELRVEETPVLEGLTPRLRELFRMDALVAFSVAPGPKSWYADFVHCTGFTPQAEHVLTNIIRTMPNSWATFSAGALSSPEHNRATVFRSSSAETIIEDEAQKIWQQLGMQNHDQLSVLVRDGQEVLAWIGGFRHKAFSGKDQFLLGAIVPSLLPRLRWERKQRAQGALLTGACAALDALPYAAFIVQPSQGVMYANRAGRELSAHQGEHQLFDYSSGTLRAAPGFELKCLDVNQLEPHYLVVQAQRDTSSRISELKARWDLTRRQQEVLGLLVQGVSNRDIAQRIGCAVRTAELHVSNVIRKAGCNSRTELTMRFWGNS